MMPARLPRSRRLIALLGPYSLAAMAVCIGIAASVWTALLVHSLPPHTNVNAASELLIAAFPMVMVTYLIVALFLAFWVMYVVLVWSQRLTRELREERAQRDAAIAQAVVERLRQEGGE